MSKFAKIGDATFQKVEKVVRAFGGQRVRAAQRVVGTALLSFFFSRSFCSCDGRHDAQNAELFILTYGAIVSQALKDNASVADVNKYLDQMYYRKSRFFWGFFCFCFFLGCSRLRRGGGLQGLQHRR